MLSRAFIFILCVVLSQISAHSQSNGGAPEAYGGAGLGTMDIWSAFYNQAGLAEIKGLSAGVFYRNEFLVPELGEGGASLAVPLGTNVASFSFRTFGYKLYREGKYSIALSRYLGRDLRFGVQINYQSISLSQEYGNTGVFTIEGGFQYQISESIMLAGHVFNPNRAKLNDFEDERMPTLIKAGMVYRYSDRVALMAEVHQPIGYEPIIRAGLEYWPGDKIALRAGISTGAVKAHFGFGLALNQINIDISATYHSLLGYTPQMALSYHGE